MEWYNGYSALQNYCVLTISLSKMVYTPPSTEFELCFPNWVKN